MVADAGDQFELVWQLDQVVVGAEGERFGFDFGLLFGTQDNQGDVAGRGVGPKEPHQQQAIDVRHHQILQDHRRRKLVGDVQSRRRIATVAKDDVLFRGQQTAHSLPDDGLIVD